MTAKTKQKILAVSEATLPHASGREQPREVEHKPLLVGSLLEVHI